MSIVANPAETAELARGFGDPVFDAQRSFRALLDALARPGLQQHAGDGLAPPAGLMPASYAIALAMFDADTPVWLSPVLRITAVTESLRFHCGAPLTEDPGRAAFALVAAGDDPPLDGFAPGEDRYPDRSTTLIWQVPDLDRGAPIHLTGPGVNGSVTIQPSGLPSGFWNQWAANHARYPLGVDLVLVSVDALIGLPRSAAAHAGLEG